MQLSSQCPGSCLLSADVCHMSNPAILSHAARGMLTCKRQAVSSSHITWLLCACQQLFLLAMLLNTSHTVEHKSHTIASAMLQYQRKPCLLIRIQRDVAVRGRDVASVIDQYTQQVKPAFDQYVAPSRKHADVIVPWARYVHMMSCRTACTCRRSPS